MRVPASFQGWLGQGLQWPRGNSLSSFRPPPIPLHSSRQAAIGLLLLDCPLHGVPRPSCLQQSLKFLQPNLSPFLPAVNAPESTAVYLLLLHCCHHQHHHQASRGPGPLCQGQRQAHPHGVTPHPSDPLPFGTDHRPLFQLGAGTPAAPRQMGTMYKHTWQPWKCPPVSGVPEPGCPISLTTPFPVSPIPALPRVGRQLGQAGACDSQGHKGRRRWALSIFFFFF